MATTTPPSLPRKPPALAIAFALGAASGAVGGTYVASIPPPTNGVCPPGYEARVIGQGLNQTVVCGDGPLPLVDDAPVPGFPASSDAGFPASSDAGTDAPDAGITPDDGGSR